MKLNLDTVGKIAFAYFILFSIFYIWRFVYAYQAFMKYHSTQTGVDISMTTTTGEIVFVKDVALYQPLTLFNVMAMLAVIGFFIWIYSISRGDKQRTTS